MIRIGVVSLGDKKKDRCEFWVAEQCPDACKEIPKIDLKCLSRDNDLVALETWSRGR